MMRFSSERGAKYYDPREARKRIHKTEFVSWACNMIVKNRPFKFVDNGDVEELDHNYFIAIRSSYLTFCQGDKFIIEPYSPHRFGRQFGYFQDSSSKAWLPGLPTNDKKLCLEAYKAWWDKAHGTFLDDNIACLINPKPLKTTLKRKKHEGKQVDSGENNPSPALVPSVVIKCNPQAVVAEAMHRDPPWQISLQRSSFLDQLEDEVQSIDTSEESETSHSLTTTPPLAMGLKRKQLPRPPAVSVFEGESFLFNHKKEFLQRLWSDLLVTISKTPFGIWTFQRQI
ncbi:UNVERIFIED_CONTAM: hypothetical protein Slati_0426500 [Sesamum latifolium]|uniref:Uncharacterized protein n=1 Tax=Sesamum latifolium TaxID=2727402 RepID=A0AAW2XV58_9LAMI